VKLKNKKSLPIAIVILVVLVIVATRFGGLLKSGVEHTKDEASSLKESVQPVTNSAPSVELTDSQLASIKLGVVGETPFPLEKEAVGSIDYNEDVSVQVFPPYQGKIVKAFANLGDDVHAGQPLYTINSPDLLAAESTLIGAAAILDLTSRELVRAKALYQSGEGIAQRELEQAISDQQSAEGELKTERDIVCLFGKSDNEIDQIIALRKADPVLVVSSPVAGRVTARNAQTGLLVQPGVAPAPFVVSDLAGKWMVANVVEIDTPFLKVGQPLKARVMAYPNRIFEGKIAALGTAVDPNTHCLMVRSEIEDPKGELRPGMLANFVIQVESPMKSPAIPVNGVVRNGDGTRAAWVTTDRHHFTQRIVKIGSQKEGQYQVLEGLSPGETVVIDGAIFLSNMLQAPVDDD
jgi:cobalt-zinc-cadmium efflux system membrane fusion protein